MSGRYTSALDIEQTVLNEQLKPDPTDSDEHCKIHNSNLGLISKYLISMIDCSQERAGYLRQSIRQRLYGDPVYRQNLADIRQDPQPAACRTIKAV